MMTEVDLVSMLSTVTGPRKTNLLDHLLKSTNCSKTSLQQHLTSVITSISNVKSGSSSLITFLQPLHSLLSHSPSLCNSNCSHLIPLLQQVLARPGIPDHVKVITFSCVDLVVSHSEISGETGRQISTATPSLISSVLGSSEGQSVSSAMTLLVTLMSRYPGSCGQSKTRVLSLLVSLIGKHTVSISLLGKCFSLVSQLGGGGKDGVDHSSSYSKLLVSIVATVQSGITSMFQHIREFELYTSDSPLLTLPTVTGGHLQLTEQLTDLMSIAGSLITSGFPTLRTIPVDLILCLPSRLLSLSLDISRDRLLSCCLLPRLIISSLQLTSSLIVATGPDHLLPEAATINSLILAGVARTDVKVRTAVYLVLEVWLEHAGASSGLELVLEKLVPVLIADVKPTKVKMVLTSSGQGGKRKNKKKGGGGANKNPTNSNISSDLDLDACSASLVVIEYLLTSFGPWFPHNLYRLVSSTLLSLALNTASTFPLPKPLLSCLSVLVNSSGQHSAGQLAFSVLDLASSSSLTESRRMLYQLQSSLHPTRLTLDVNDTIMMSQKKIEMEETEAEQEQDYTDVLTQTENDNLEKQLKDKEVKINELQRELVHARSLNNVGTGKYADLEGARENIYTLQKPDVKASILLDSNEVNESISDSSKRAIEESTINSSKRAREESISDSSKRDSEECTSYSPKKTKLNDKTENLKDDDINELNEEMLNKRDDSSNEPAPITANKEVTAECRTNNLNENLADGEQQTSVEDMMNDFNSRLNQNISVGNRSSDGHQSDSE